MSLFLTMGFVHCRHLISTLCCFWSNKVVAAAKSPGCMQMELNRELIADIDKKPLAEVVNGGGAIKAAAAAHKKHYDPPKPDTVIVISSNEELESEEKKPVAVIARKSRVRSSRMPHKTRPMTALLLFTGLNVILVSTITSVYDCLLSSILGQRERTLSSRTRSYFGKGI